MTKPEASSAQTPANRGAHLGGESTPPPLSAVPDSVHRATADHEPPVGVETANESLTEPPQAYWGLTRGDQYFLGGCLLVSALLMLWRLLQLSGWGHAVIEIDRLPARQYEYRLDVNRAAWYEWALLEGIGETIAKRIVANRDEQGPFKSLDEIPLRMKGKGIGPKTWDKMRPWLTINSETSP